MGKLKHELWTFCKAQLSAQAATLTDFLVSLLLAEAVGLYYVWASLLGAVAGGIVNCTANYRWVFQASELQKSHVAAKYVLVWTGSIGLNTLGTYLLTEVSGQYFLIAKAVVAVAVAVVWNYQMQRLFVYRETHLLGKKHRDAR